MRSKNWLCIPAFTSVITQLDDGYRLRCSGCGWGVSLTFSEVRNLDRALDIKSELQRVHKDCDSFGDVAKARAAIRATEQAERQATRGGGKR